MRIIIKGGVWKNTEDEVLKAAVMKYGKNQWARVASLLARKSAKQCKARWYEWLDPSIKKTEWNREEEEKLLHLAKLMPSQWRTIAPIVGRTAGQCMEHYEKLLDAAQNAQGLDILDDPRRLRPGEIDPNPEGKPARPDPVDMDEDEKEMLSEARARLANTQGKKAKRKAREKQLEETRRMASLQKRREMKAAGMSGGSSRHMKRKFMDYVNEIPFETVTPAGFYDVGEEASRSQSSADPHKSLKRIDQLEGKSRDDEEKKARKIDAARQKRLAKSQLPQQMAAINEKNDPSRALKRKKLELPTAQVSNAELHEIVKVGYQNATLAAQAASSSNSATQDLIGDYQTTPLEMVAGKTPLRTPSVSSGTDVIMQEAANLAALAQENTPLLGGDNIQLLEGTGYAGMTPRTSRMKTPLLMNGASGAMMLRTPGTNSSRMSTGTPMRDDFNINPEVEEMTSRKLEKAREREARSQLSKGFSSLPSAQNAYDIALPQLADEESRGPNRVEDAGDRNARLAASRDAEKERELSRRSSVLQKELPRPGKLTAQYALRTSGDIVHDMVHTEMIKLVQYDEIKYPVRKKKNNVSGKIQMDTINDDDVERARNAVDMEMKLTGGQVPSLDVKEYTHVLDTYLGSASDPSQSNALKAWKQTFAYKKDLALKNEKTIAKLTQRVQVLQGGYIKRAEELKKNIQQADEKLFTSRTERSCYSMLQTMEAQALPTRLSTLASALDSSQDKQAEWQAKFADLQDEQTALQKQMAL